MPRKTYHLAAMTPADFDRLAAAKPRTSPGVIAACRSVLVDGHSIAAAAANRGFTRQRLKAALDRINPVGVPLDWERRWVALPADKMQQVIELERQARASLMQGGATVGRKDGP